MHNYQHMPLSFVQQAYIFCGQDLTKNCTFPEPAHPKETSQ